MYTLFRAGIKKGEPLVKRAIVVCPTSLVQNWANEIRKWLGTRLESGILFSCSLLARGVVVVG